MKLSGKQGQGARKPQFARELDGERAGGERRLTNATKRGEKGSKRRNDTRRRLLLRRRSVLPGRDGEREKKNGVRGAVQARARAISFSSQNAGKEGEIVGAGKGRLGSLS